MFDRRLTLRLLAPALACGLAACGPVLQTPSAPGLVASQQADFLAAPYRIRAGDQVEVKHRLATELNDLAVVRPDGKISLPLIASVPAAGLSSDELEANLRQAYARDLRKPELSVMVRSFATQRVFVGGEVERPGMVDLVDGQTVMQAVYAAGGLKDTARTDEIVVIRRGEADQRLVFAINLDDAVSGNNLKQDVRLLPLDTVVVPRSDIARVDLWVDQYLRKVLPANLNASAVYTFGTTNTNTR